MVIAAVSAAADSKPAAADVAPTATLATRPTTSFVVRANGQAYYRLLGHTGTLLRLSSIAIRETIECQSPRPSLWQAIASTHRFNQAIRNPPIVAAELDNAGAARYVVTQRLAGLELNYEERPFEWRASEFVSIQRRFLNGPALDYTLTWGFEDRPDGGTIVTQVLESTPRSWLFWPFVRLHTGKFARALAAQVRDIDDSLRAGMPAFHTARRSRVHVPALDEACAELTRLVAPEQVVLVERLRTFIAEAGDVDVARIRPYALVRRWELDDTCRRELLVVCLLAVRAGLLELTWEILCPSCRAAADELDSLAELTETGHCHFCDLSIAVDLDQAVEAAFRPAPHIRSVPTEPYCIGGPFRTPHVLEQVILQPDARACVSAPAEPGRYRIFARGGDAVRVSVKEGGPQRMAIELGGRGQAPVEVSAGASVDIHNPTDHERHVKLERVEWLNDAATAYDISLLPQFRREFSAEVVRAGVALKVARVAVLFTDLSGSTAMYERMGDAVAYRFVQENFDLSQRVIEANHGAVVKTIGDAVMAAFASAENAVAAAVSLQRAFVEFADRQSNIEGVQLKVGINAGPCYAVTANGVFDYFGQTINTAARLEALAGPGTIIVPTRLLEKCKSLPWWRDVAEVTEFEAALRGVSAPVQTSRLHVA